MSNASASADHATLQATGNLWYREAMTERKTMKMKSRQAYTMIEIMIVVAIIGIVSAIAVPNFMKYRKDSHKTACINQMKSILAAIEEARLERDTEMLETVRNSGKIDALVSGTPGQNNKNKYLPEMVKCPTGNAEYLVDFSDDEGYVYWVECQSVAKDEHGAVGKPSAD